MARRRGGAVKLPEIVDGFAVKPRKQSPTCGGDEQRGPLPDASSPRDFAVAALRPGEGAIALDADELLLGVGAVAEERDVAVG